MRIGCAEEAGVAIAKVSGELRDHSSSASLVDWALVVAGFVSDCIVDLLVKRFAKSVLNPDVGFWPLSGIDLGRVMVNAAFSVLQAVEGRIAVDSDTLMRISYKAHTLAEVAHLESQRHSTIPDLLQ